MKPYNLATDEPIVEAYEWIETSRLSELVANFARVHILISLFDGDPEKWLQFIRTEGTAEERQYDLPFVEDLRQRLEEVIVVPVDDGHPDGNVFEAARRVEAAEAAADDDYVRLFRHATPAGRRRRHLTRSEASA